MPELETDACSVSRFTFSRFTFSRFTLHASRFTLHASRPPTQHGEDMLQLILHLARPGHGLRDLFAEQFTVTPAHTMHGLFHRVFGQAKVRAQFGVAGA